MSHQYKKIWEWHKKSQGTIFIFSMFSSNTVEQEGSWTRHATVSHQTHGSPRNRTQFASFAASSCAPLLGYKNLGFTWSNYRKYVIGKIRKYFGRFNGHAKGPRFNRFHQPLKEPFSRVLEQNNEPSIASGASFLAMNSFLNYEVCEVASDIRLKRYDSVSHQQSLRLSWTILGFKRHSVHFSHSVNPRGRVSLRRLKRRPP